MAGSSFLFFTLLVYGLGAVLSQSLMSLGGAICAVAAVVLALRYRGTAGTPSACQCDRPFVLVTGAWVLFQIVNLSLRPWTPSSTHTLGNLPLFLVPTLAVLTREKLSSRQWRLLFVILGAAYVASLSYALAQVTQQHLQASSFMRNPIYYAYTLLPAFVFFAEMWRRGRSFAGLPAFVLGVVSLVILLAIGASVNRMVGLIAIAYICTRLLPALLRRQRRWMMWLVPALLVVGAGLSYVVTLPQVKEKIERSFSGNDPSVHWRSVAWQHNLELFRAHPLFGVGPEKNGIDPASDPMYQGNWEPGHIYYAHSIYFQVLAEGGIVGILLFLAYFVFLYRVGGPLTRAVVIAVLVGGLSENIFNNSRPSHAVYFYLLLAILVERSRDFNATASTDPAFPAG